MLRKATLLSFISLTLALTFANIAWASPIIPIPSKPAQPIVTPSAPNIDAKGYILIDANSGKVLAEKNADGRMPPASLTKLMSLYIISGALKNGSIHLNDKVRISEKAWRTGGSRMFIKVNDEVDAKSLMEGIAVASGNDASVAMAEFIAGTEEGFANIMNAQAKELGMNNSHFIDSTGLPNPNHYSTPRDFAILAQALTTTFPEDYKLFSEKWFMFNGIKQPNRNRLLWRFQYADGLKTGHTDEAGYCLVASALKDKMRLISVVMGAPSDAARTEDSIRLLTYGFRFFETHKIHSADTPLAVARVWKGSSKTIKLGLNEAWYATLPAGQYKNVQLNIQVDPLTAPIVKGQTCGSFNIMLNNQIIASKPIIALTDDPKGGILRRATDSVSFKFHQIFTKSSDKMNNA
ncbi:MAG: D-alanyl-D-alanine carboxypeptidase [Gammaproteobacteria bacterium]|nr:D-alanyl-D-alanine carboxypeptidase [Gammaproteobacteria bacterium]